MSQRSDAVRAHVERLNAEVLAVVAGLSVDEWHATTASEAWPVGYAVRHIANGYAAVLDWVAAGRRGQPHQSDPEAIHAGNAAGLASYGPGEPEEVLALLRSRQQAVLELVDQLQEHELDIPALVGATGQQRTVEQVLTTLLEAHTRTHLDSIRATVTTEVPAA
jgi:DinB family protein